jgi:hypothetical protein
MAIDHSEFLLKQLDTVQSRFAIASDRNFITQIIAVALGITHIYKPLLSTAVVKAAKLDVPIAVVSILVPVLLFYLFLRFGYLLWSFLETRKMIDALLARLHPTLPNVFPKMGYRRMFRAPTIFEVILPRDNGAIRWFDYLPLATFSLFVSGIISLNHALVFHYLTKADALGSTAFLALMSLTAAVIAACYVQFILRVDDSWLKLVSITSLLLVYPAFHVLSA